MPEPRFGRPAFRGNDNPLVEKQVGHLHRRIQDAARIVSQIENQPGEHVAGLLLHCVGHFVDGSAQLVCRGIVELAHANVTVSRLQDFVAHTRNRYLLPRQVKRQRVVIIIAAYPDSDRRAGATAHLPDCFIQSIVTRRYTVDLDNLVTGLYPRALRRRAVYWGDHEDRAILRADLEPYTRVSAARAVTNIPVFLCVEELGVTVEPGHHAADGAVHQFRLIDRLDEIPAHAFHDLVDEPRLLPGQFLVAWFVAPGQHAAAERQAQSQDRADDDDQDAPGFQ